MGLIELIVENGVDETVADLPKGIRGNESSVAETIENNMRRLIIDENPINPKYYEEMSELLDALIQERKEERIKYKEYLEKIKELAAKVVKPMKTSSSYPDSVNTRAKQSLYDNLGENEALAIAVDAVIRHTKKDGWNGDMMKERELKRAIKRELGDKADMIDEIMELVKHQDEYN